MIETIRRRGTHIVSSMAVVVTVTLLVTYAVLGTCYNVVDGEGRRWDELFRFKRDKVNKRGFTTAEKQELLDLHNKYRREESATDMKLMEWDHGLAKVAQEWADKCIWTHRTDRYNAVPNFNYMGENLYVRTDVPTPQHVVKNWADEKDFYNYNTGQCSKVCGHYTQVVWASSYALGCGIRFCSNIQNLDWQQYGGGYIVVCNYGPGGNVLGQKPYTRGQPACSACSEDFPYCTQGRCSKSNPYVEPTTIPVTTVDMNVNLDSGSGPCSLIGGYIGLFFVFVHLFFMIV